ADLLRALITQHDDVRLFAVGDDWQSIYRFAGSDVYLMRNFGAEFGGHFAGKDEVHKIVDLGRTFRSVDKIALPARRFVLQNKSQIEKKVAARSANNAPSIFVAWTESDEGDDELNNALKQLNTQGGTMDNRVSVLLLGRYKKPAPKNLTTLEQKYKNLKIDFKTIHGAKGLEADHVIILRANSGWLGFPNEIADDPILNLVLPTPELFHHAEERRVFYVALTRARASVTILTSINNPSDFAIELLSHPDYGVVERGGAVISPYPCPECDGRMVKRFKNLEPFWGCVNYSKSNCTGTLSMIQPVATHNPLPF
ncbi:MAG: UvrD-helicase domain-containing protein, partial [Proteobacteria bacterium]|nr:UvrD-helicase domain-containing protein [Pseudomonadota bacterium]